MRTVSANYYDGRSARKQAVTLRIFQGQLEVRGDEVIRTDDLSSVRISAKLGRAPRLLNFVGGGHCEVSNNADFEELLREAGAPPHSLLSSLENSWHHALTATVISIIIAIASFYWGLPLIAKIAAERISESIALSIDTHFLDAVDNGLMRDSNLGIGRQNELRKRFNNLHYVKGLPSHQLKFRNSKVMGANAFALPGGTVVITDQLIALASNDEEILSVLAHELGHVSEHHPMRQLLQSSVVGLAMAWFLGDVSSLLAAAPTLLMETSYSRDFERHADRFAASMLRENGIAPAHLADMLEKLEKSHGSVKQSIEKPSRIAQFLSTHPDTGERIRDLRSEFSGK